MFPFKGMPVWAQWIGEIFPTTRAMRIVRGVLLKGNGVPDMAPELWDADQAGHDVERGELLGVVARVHHELERRGGGHRLERRPSESFLGNNFPQRICGPPKCCPFAAIIDANTINGGGGNRYRGAGEFRAINTGSRVDTAACLCRGQGTPHMPPKPAGGASATGLGGAVCV